MAEPADVLDAESAEAEADTETGWAAVAEDSCTEAETGVKTDAEDAVDWFCEALEAMVD